MTIKGFHQRCIRPKLSFRFVNLKQNMIEKHAFLILKEPFVTPYQAN